MSIPIFTAQLKKARFATNQANARAAYAAAVAERLTNDTVTAGDYDVATGTFTAKTAATAGTVTVDATTKGQPGSWSVDDTDLASLGTAVYKENVGITMNADGEITTYAFK